MRTWPSLYHLGGCVMQVKSNCTSYPIPCVQTHLFAPTKYWNFLSGNLHFHKALLSMGDYPLFSRCSLTMTKRGWKHSWATAESTAKMEVCLPITQCTSGQGFSRSVGVWCWIPQLLQRHFCSWMGAKFLLLRIGGGGTNKGHLMLLRCWYQLLYICNSSLCPVCISS